ncbi:MAG: STAS domain-containing protein [Actinomycetota bacterium]|nr:STAS domain-containing protein [Actinomycetota bacterium]
MVSMQLSTREGGGHVVGLSGELDAVDAADVAAAITKIITPGQCLIVDLAALEFIDCCALGALLEAQKLARQEGGDLRLAAPRGSVLRVLTLTGWDDVFSVHTSVAAAAASIGGAAPQYATGRPEASPARPATAAPLSTES